MSGYILRELEFLPMLYAPGVFERIREFLIVLSSVDTGICETDPGNTGRATSDDGLAQLPAVKRSFNGAKA